MKRVLALFRSMRFGLVLLSLVMAFSLVGSLIPQDRVEGWYTQAYPRGGPVILALGIDRLFETWYFVALVGLLGLNLTVCSVSRFGSVHRARKAALDVTDAHERHVVGGEVAERLGRYLADRRYHRHEAEGVAVYYKNMLGYYGSFVVHLSLLLILVFGGLVLSLSDVGDYPVMPGETLTLDDGTTLELDNFRMTDETGRTDYASLITVTTPNGIQSAPREISVNRPFTFHAHKYYQHTYGTAGSITAVNTTTGGSDTFYLTERSFLSSGGRNGVWFEALYPGFVEDEHGHIIPLSPRGLSTYPNPVYQVLVSADGQVASSMRMPGETVEVGDIIFTFNDPANYPGIRIKRIPNPFPPLLYASFVLITLGLWLCFFYMPGIVAVYGDSYALAGAKMSVAQFEIDAFFNNINKEMNTP